MSSTPPGSGNRPWFEDRDPGAYKSPLTGVVEEGAEEPVSFAEPEAAPPPKLDHTDFDSIKHTLPQPERRPTRTWTDTLIDAFTPCLIFVMVYSVVFFLLDVRYVYTAVHDTNLRIVAFAFLVGVVALNRLIARDGHEESIIYMFGLAFMVGLYTLSTTRGYGVGSFAKNFMNQPYLATLFNVCIVAFLWWVTNRLTHECCVDENKVAGDIGIMTGTMRRFQRAISRDPKAVEKKSILVSRSGTADDKRWLHMDAYDPTEYQRPESNPKHKIDPAAAPPDRLPTRHPGISIFYFAIAAFVVFTLGLRVIQHGGPPFVLAGWFYLSVFSISALMLLMLTSLAGLREYFRARYVTMPDHIGWIWIGTGTVMIAMVLIAASQMPMPELPPIAQVAEHETDPWDRGQSQFELSPVSEAPARFFHQSKVLDFLGTVVLTLMAVAGIFAGLKGLGVVAAWIGRQRDRFPRFVVHFFDWLDELIVKLTRLPALRPKRRIRRIDRSVATCTQYSNPLGDPQTEAAFTPQQHVEFAYEALCALAQDLGVPRSPDETPYEFIKSFPEELKGLEDEALQLTRLYVMAAYAPDTTEERVKDALRRFWIAYNRIRNRVVK